MEISQFLPILDHFWVLNFIFQPIEVARNYSREIFHLIHWLEAVPEYMPPVQGSWNVWRFGLWSFVGLMWISGPKNAKNMGIFTIETFLSVYNKSGCDFSIFSILGHVIAIRAKKAKFQFQALRSTKWKKEVPQWPMAPKYEVSKVKMPIFFTC